MRTVGLVTSSRSDWGLQRTIAEALRARNDVDLRIIACGMHLSRDFGFTVDCIIDDGFEVAHRVEFLQPGDRPADIADSMGRGVSAFANMFHQWRPDVLSVLGDRYDMFPAAVAAVPFLIPVAHIHGGETTHGAFDDSLRHAITMMSHIHLAATVDAADRIRRMGADPQQVYVVGAPGLDDLIRLIPLGDHELLDRFSFSPGQVNVLVAFHPETRAYEQTPAHVEALLSALAHVDANIVFVSPNADTSNGVISEAFDEFCGQRTHATMPARIPRRSFLSLMQAASVMIGNSSAGLIEASSFSTPVVNIGGRQEGRLRAANVIDCSPSSDAIADAISKALSVEFIQSLVGMENPYGDGHSGGRIAEILASTPL